MDGLIAYTLSKQYVKKLIDEKTTEGFKIQIEQNRTILSGVGEEKVFYFIPKVTAKPQDGYDEYIYVNNSWEQVGATDIDLSTYATKDWTLEQISKINKINIADAVVTLEANSFVYDGTPKVPTVQSVVLNGTQLTHGVDYAVVVNPATNAGSYVLSVDGIGDHTGVVAVNWGITKAQAAISGDDSISIIGMGESVSKTFSTNGDGTFSFSTSGGIATTSNIGGTVTVISTSIGNGIMMVSVSEGQNYLRAEKTVNITVEEAVTATVFGVMWDYSLSSPQLVRLTPQTDPLGVVTTVPLQEPTACVGNDGNGQSDFDNYMPWAGMQRYNYVNGQVVDFVDYNNGETFVYIPEFWSKIVDDSTNSKMYFYISDMEIEGFAKHSGSDRYIGRYPCNENFLSVAGYMPKVNTSLTNFRIGITSIDNKHFQFDIHTYSARNLLYLIEFAHLNTQSKIGAGITSGSVQTLGQTDALTYHTGRVSGTDNVSAVQYRWIENPWGNVSRWIDGILIQDGKIYICNDETLYDSSITNNYNDTGIVTLTSGSGWLKTESNYNNQYIFAKTVGGSDSTYLCDNSWYGSGLRGLIVSGTSGSGSGAGLFSWGSDADPGLSRAFIGGRSILILSSGGDS